MNEWHKLTSDLHILDIVSHCHLDLRFSDIGPLFFEEVEYVFSEEERLIIDQEIVKVLELGVIKETHRQKEQTISPIFLRKKKDGGFRMILNLQKLNEHIYS